MRVSAGVGRRACVCWEGERVRLCMGEGAWFKEQERLLQGRREVATVKVKYVEAQANLQIVKSRAV